MNRKQYIISPIVVGLFGLSLFIFVYLFAPIKPKVSLEIHTILYITISYIMFFLGCFAFYLAPTKNSKHVLNTSGIDFRGINKQFNLSIALAILGIAFRLIDRFYLRNVSIFQSALENRELLSQADSSIISILGAVIYPICFLVLFLFLKKNGKLFTLTGLIVLLLFFFPTFDSFLFGSRSLILINITMLLLILKGTGRLNIRLIQIFTLLVLLVCLIALSGYMFLSRLEEMGLNVLDTIYISGYATTVAPNSWVAEKLSTGLTFTNTLLFSWLNFSQYYTHGLFEFNNYLGMAIDKHSYGATQFNVVYKLIAKLFSLPSLSVVLEGVNPRPGVFTTFFGPSHMDYSYFSYIITFLFGLISAALHRRITISQSYYSVLYYMVVIIIFFMPVVNFIQSAQGLYIIFSVIFFSIVNNAINRLPNIKIVKRTH